MTALCRVPAGCVIRVKTVGLEPSGELFSKLVDHCRGLEFDVLSSPWAFDEQWSVPIRADDDAQLLESKLVSWAMSQSPCFAWVEGQRSTVAPQSTSALEFEWREGQAQMAALLSKLRSDGIGILEGSTGIGKTRMACQSIINTLESGAGSVLVSVPTVIVAQQWIAELAEIDPNVAVQPVLGRKHYAKAKDQEIALKSATHAQLVICTHHMLTQVIGLQRWQHIIDEAHLLYFAVAATAGRFLPMSAMGAGFEKWCVDHLGLIEGLAQEVELSGKMRKAVLSRFGSGTTEKTQAFAVVQVDGEVGVTVREPDSCDGVLDMLWSSVRSAVLLSATQASRSSAGVRSIHVSAQRLRIPLDRLQDLGQIKATWRDRCVTVLKPECAKGVDGRVWLSPHAARKQEWHDEVAQVVKQWSQGRRKTLMLATSYEDVAGIYEACKAQGIGGVLASSRELSMHELKLAFDTEQIWLWIATGAAWTGMDLKVRLERLAITKLPLQVPDDDLSMESLQAHHFDCVNRLKQGVGRLVRGQSEIERELVLLDGRINETSPWWRSMCQPYLQVFAEDYEDHTVLQKPEEL